MSSEPLICKYDDVIPRTGAIMPLKVNYDIKISEKNIEQLRKLNVACFPVRYGEQFYRDVLLRDKKLTILAYFADNLIGAIGCRVEDGHKLYIMTLCVLKPYRRMHIGHHLVEKMLEVAHKDTSIDQVYLHVQTNNQCAITFYQQFGFELDAEIRNYYRRIEPPNCYVLVKMLPRDSPAAPAS